MSLDLDVIRPATSSTSMLKSLDSYSFIGTGTPPTKRIIDSYIGNPGFGYNTSSPESTSASMVKNITGLPPGVMTTLSPVTDTPLV